MPAEADSSVSSSNSSVSVGKTKGLQSLTHSAQITAQESWENIDLVNKRGLDKGRVRIHHLIFLVRFNNELTNL